MTSSNKKIIIAIDGYSSSGKSTMSKSLAAAIGYRYIDSGAMYRAVTLNAIRKGFFPDGQMDLVAVKADLPSVKIEFRVGADGKSHTFLNGEDVESRIREMDVADKVSPIATVPEVRAHVNRTLQEMGRERGIVMDGRDIGTTVFPDAEMKVFVNASPEERARRRLNELKAKGDNVTYEEVLHNICERDHIDRTRKESPLRQAPDAILLDNDSMTLEEQEKWLLNLYYRISGREQTV